MPDIDSDTEEKDDLVLRVARAIATDGFGRSWDDFLPLNINDTDQSDLIEYATAAIDVIFPHLASMRAALEPFAKAAEPFGYLLEKSGVDNGYYFIRPAEFALMEERFRTFLIPVYTGSAPAAPTGDISALKALLEPAKVRERV